MNNVENQEIDTLLENTDSDVRELLKDTEKLLRKKPFTRGGRIVPSRPYKNVSPGSSIRAQHSAIRKEVISQDQYMAELDPNMHEVLRDDNIPSICVKLADGNVKEIKFEKTAVSFQQSIMEKQTLHLASLPMNFTLSEKKPTDEMQSDFVTFKHYWDLRNQDGMKVKMVATAKSFGEAGLLFYHDRKGEIKSRLISYEDGYVICSHNDANGDRILEAVYYQSDGEECIDCWDDKACYHFRSTPTGDFHITVEAHDFGEIPLVTKRCHVAWEHSHSHIPAFERLYNIFLVLQNKWGWGILYIKGRVDPKAQKIAGNIVINDVSLEGKGDAKFLDPPKPDNLIQTLENIFQNIQITSGTTFILPKDIHTSSDTSGVAVQMTQSLDIQTAQNGVVDWQNVADKMTRLFKRGLGIELVNKNKKNPNIGKPTAITDFDKLNINAKFEIWQPFSASEYNQMLATMKNAGVLSRRTAIEANTISRPDEVERVLAEMEEDMQMEMAKLAAQNVASTEQNNPKGQEE